VCTAVKSSDYALEAMINERREKAVNAIWRLCDGRSSCVRDADANLQRGRGIEKRPKIDYFNAGAPKVRVSKPTQTRTPVRKCPAPRPVKSGHGWR
jgi:hypothetical protein